LNGDPCLNSLIINRLVMKWVVDYLYPKNFDHSDIPDLHGKVVLVTGGCSGLGFEIASQCAGHNAAKLIILSYPSPRLAEAVDKLSKKLSDSQGIPGLDRPMLAKVVAVPCDLGNLSEVLDAVARIKTMTSTIDILFANAGVTIPQTSLSADGLDAVFAVNHVGHYALVTRLLPILIHTASLEGSDVRVVITSSLLAWRSHDIDFNNLTTPFGKGMLLHTYSRSKLCNLLFGMQLAKHVRERGTANIRVNVAEPGSIFSTGVHTLAQPSYGFLQRRMMAIGEWWFGISVSEGALTLLFVGTSPRIKEEDRNGQFYRPFGDLIPRNKYPKYASEALAEKLWDWTEDFVSKRETK
jgi:NAD(P)-dependent dehydrogenase (short-subunit alcohol dehydrogenase family)